MENVCLVAIGIHKFSNIEEEYRKESEWNKIKDIPKKYIYGCLFADRKYEYGRSGADLPKKSMHIFFYILSILYNNLKLHLFFLFD